MSKELGTQCVMIRPVPHPRKENLCRSQLGQSWLIRGIYTNCNVTETRERIYMSPSILFQGLFSVLFSMIMSQAALADKSSNTYNNRSCVPMKQLVCYCEVVAPDQKTCGQVAVNPKNKKSITTPYRDWCSSAGSVVQSDLLIQSPGQCSGKPFTLKNCGVKAVAANSCVFSG